ncbi:MAG: hypothetical protein PVH62_09255, partial [Anaerolineae bacterium]
MDSRRVMRLSLAVVLLLIASLAIDPAVTAVANGPGVSGFRALGGEEAAAFAVPGDMELVLTFPLPKYGLTYERYQQYFGPAKVLGGQITLYRSDDGVVSTVIGAHYPDIAPSNTVGLSMAAARGIVDRDIGAAGERLVDLMV